MIGIGATTVVLLALTGLPGLPVPILIAVAVFGLA